MPAKIISDEYRYYDIVFNATAECGVDTEYYLPDYCPDIQKVLKCCVTPHIESSSVAGDRLNITGNVGISVMYCDEKAVSIRSCDFSKDFSCTVKLQNETSSPVIEVFPHCGHIVCRAVNARKLDVHIPMLLDCNVFSCVSEGYTKDIEAAEKLTAKGTVSEAILFFNREISINNEFELPESAPPIESILRKDVRIRGISYTAEDNLLSVRGSIDFTVCYKSYAEGSVLEKMSYTTEFFEEIPCDGVSDKNGIWEVQASPLSYSVQLKEDSVGEYTRLSLYMKVCLRVLNYKNTDIYCVKDAFTADCLSKEKYGKVNHKLYEPDKLRNEVVRSVGLDSCERILDIWCSDFTVAAFTEPGRSNYRGSFMVNVIYTGQNKRLSSAVKPCDFSIASELTDTYQRKAAASGTAELVDFRLLSESEAEIKVKITVDSLVSVKKVSEQVEDLEYIGPLPEHSCGKIILCYDSTQGLWSLGKKHRIPVEDIKAANDIIDEAECKYPLILFR